MIRTTNHSLKFTNSNKIEKYTHFLNECLSTANQYLDYLWNNKIQFEIKEQKKFFDIKNDYLEIPNMLSNPDIESKIENFNSKLSGRARKCILTQVLGIIKATTEVRRKRLFIFNKLCEENKYNEKLYLNLQEFPSLKPNLDNINFEFNSICSDYQKTDGYFNGFLQLMSIGDMFGKIRIPIKFHRNNKKYQDWKMMNSFLLGKDFVNIRWEKEQILKDDGSVIGADQGKLTILTLSDRQTTPKTDNHGHSLDSIIEKLSRKKKGSKSFEKTQEHRKNFIHWSINQLNFNNVKHIKLEEVININYGRKQCRSLSHWTNTIIRDKISSRCEVNGVYFTLQSCIYRSQRCSQCGLVRKSNRKGKIYICGCGYSDDADFNASCNHEQTLPDIPTKLRKLNLNRKGFYWKESGFYDLTGVSLTVEPNPTIKQS